MERKRSAFWVKIVSMALLAISFSLLLISLAKGEMELYLLFVIPVVRVQGVIGILGFLLLIVSMVFIFLSFARADVETDVKGLGKGIQKGSKWGGVIFLGPFPIVIGNKEVRKEYPSWWKLLVLGIFVLVLVNLIMLLLVSVIT